MRSFLYKRCVFQCGDVMWELTPIELLDMQGVEADDRGSFSSTEASLQNIFELASFTSTLVFPRPEEFRYPALLSAVAVLIAGSLYAEFVRRRRGHLLHTSNCIARKDSLPGAVRVSAEDQTTV